MDTRDCVKNLKPSRDCLKKCTTREISSRGRSHEDSPVSMDRASGARVTGETRASEASSARGCDSARVFALKRWHIGGGVAHVHGTRKEDEKSDGDHGEGERRAPVVDLRDVVLGREFGRSLRQYDVNGPR